MGSFQTFKAKDGFEFRGYVSLPPCGAGPGLLVLQEVFGINPQMRRMCDAFAEEGYVTVAPDLFARLERDVDLGYSPEEFEKAIALYNRFDVDTGMGDIAACFEAVRRLPACTGKVGAIGFCLGGKLVVLAAQRLDLACAISYYGVGIEQTLDKASQVKCPIVMHFAALDTFSPPATVSKISAAFADHAGAAMYSYPGVDHAFASPERPAYNKPAALMAYSRSLAALRRAMGPEYNLSALWDKHLQYEFADRDVENNMKTMVAEPYVNDIPTLTGGIGYKELHNFYQHHFMFANPADTRTIPVSRTIGADRIVDEMIFCFTHDREIDWMLPGVSPTGKYVEVPLVAIVCFRGDKIYHEHIYWDQASVLVQIGLLAREGLPVVGIESAQKMINEQLPSNLLMKNCHFRRHDAPAFPPPGTKAA